MTRQPFQLNYIFFFQKKKIKMWTKNSWMSLEDCFKKQKVMNIHKFTFNFTTCLSVILVQDLNTYAGNSHKNLIKNK